MSLDLLETITFSNKLSTNFSIAKSEDGRISLLTENGILVYTLMNYIDNIFTDIAFKKKLVKTPDYSFSNELKNNFDKLYNEIPKDDLFERVLRLDLTSELHHSTPIEIKPISVAWSPRGLQGDSLCLLTILTNVHGLSIFIKSRDDALIEYYHCISNVTEYIVHYFRLIMGSFVDSDIKAWLSGCVNFTTAVCPTAFVWSHRISTEGNVYAILFVSHPDGSISCWKFFKRKECDTALSSMEFCTIFKTSLGNITTMYWNKAKKFGGALCYGNLSGQIAVITVCDLDKENISFENEVIFWDEKDEKKIDHITSIDYEDYTYLFGVKEEFLLIYSIHKYNGKVMGEKVIDMGNLSITGLTHYKENILFVLTAGRLKTIKVNNMINGGLKTDEEIVPLKLDCTKLKTHGLFVSENKVFVGILAYPCKLQDISRVVNPSTLLIYHNTTVDPFQTIMNNSDGSIEKYWDCFETLRLISYKEKRFPWEGIEDNIDYDKMSLTKLKSLRWVAKLSEKTYSIIPYIKDYKIMAYALLHHLVTIKFVLNRMRKLLKKLSEDEELTLFQWRSLDIQTMFLKEMVLMRILERAGVGERFVDEMIEVLRISNELRFPDMPPCLWCNEKIIGPSCIPPHADSRCVISMMQIFMIPGFKCEFCKSLAHPEVAKEMEIVICPYCDVPMEQIFSREKIEEILKETNENNRERLAFVLQDDIPQVPFIPRPKDCLIDDMVSLEEGEDEVVEYLALSDSEVEAEGLEEANQIVEELLGRNKQKEIINEEVCEDLEEEMNVKEVVAPEIVKREGGRFNEDNSDYSFDEGSENEEKNS